MEPLVALALVALACPMVGIFLLYLLASLRQVNQWEAGLKFTLGKFSGTVDPGLHVAWRVFQRIVRIDTRIRNRDLLQQSVITADNVSAMIDAVVYYKVVDPVKAGLNVENFELAVKDRSKVVLRDIVGETRLDDLLAHREEIAAKVRVAVEQFVSQWGLHVELIALQDIQLPSNMQEVIARKAIAERDRQYVIIKSQADVESARNFAEAARILSSEPGAMELRRLEALQNLTAAGTSKVIFDLAKPLEAEQSRAAAVAAALTDDRARDPRTGVRVGAPRSRAEPQAAEDDEAALAQDPEALGRAPGR